jgi:hypothetical protein
LEITKTVLSLMLVMITILTTLTILTTTIEVYAGGGDDGNDGDGNKQKAEDDSSAAIADCDDNDVEEARFLCIALATNDIEIETPEEEERATLSVCKEVSPGFGEPEDFFMRVTGNNPSPDSFRGNANCVDVTIGPGEYAVSEAAGNGLPPVEITGDCVEDPNAPLPGSRATGEIQAGETQTCTFNNIIDD